MVNKDKWSALSLKDRADLIKLYVESGITDLGEMRKNYNSFDNGGNIESIVYEEGIEEDDPNYNNVYTLSRDTGDYMENWYSQRQNIGLNSFYNKTVDEYNKKYEDELIIPKVKAPVGTNNKVGEYVVAPGSNGIVTKNPFYYEKDLEVAKDYLKDFNRRSGNFKIRFDNTSRYAGRYDPNEGNLIHISTKVPNDARLNYAVHEATHSLTNRDFNFDSDYLGHLPKDNTSYFGNSSEQYARIMQLRNYLNLDPNKVYTEDEVNKFREDIEFKYPNTREHLGDNLLFRYSNKEIADMLNNSFDDGGSLDTPTTEEPIYYDDTYIEPAVVKAFKNQKDYNRYLGEKGARTVREGTNKIADTIAKGLRFTPVVGDVMDGVEAYEEAKTGNLTKAGVLAGLTLLPNAVEKPIKAVSKPLKRYLTHGIDNDLFTLSMKKWKGSPMPSMSVNDLDIPMFDYGDMTFIGSEDLLDNSIIFKGDGLTPTIGTVGGNEMMDPQEVIKRMKEQQKRKGEYNIGQIISKGEASTLPMRGGTEDYFEAKYQDFIPWNKFKHLVTKGELHPDLIKLIEDIGIPHTNVSEENYLEAIRKIAEETNLMFNNGGKINRFETGGPTNQNVDSNWLKSFKELPDGYKNAILQLVTNLNYDVKDAESLYNSGKLKAVIEAKYQNTPSGRVRQNDSPTSTESSNLEKKMNRMLFHSTDRVLPNMKYAIPYIEELEVKVPGVGRTTTNALDSLAKYAVQAQIPLSEALGLSAQETAFGALPQYNYVEIVGTEEEKQKARDFNRALGNSSYFRNYGIIPAENFVRDFRYNIVEDPIDRDVPPLLHAFNYWKKGNYNRGDSDHTKDVKTKGEAVMKTKVIQDWINSSKYAQKALNLFK